MLENKTAVVTGASRGIGRAIAPGPGEKRSKCSSQLRGK